MTTKFYQKSIDEVVKIFTTNLNEGLKKEEVTERLTRDGYNEFEKKEHTTLLQKFISQFKSFMI